MEERTYAWGRINRAFSEPVTLSDDVADYAPTQVLAEAFRSAGCDAIKYGSRLGDGKTIAIFNLCDAKQRSCHLYRVEGVTLKYVPEDESHFLNEPDENSPVK
jgi:hypothetical protein